MTYIQIDILMLSCIGVILSVFLLYLQYSKKRKLPPGPVGWPILGCYPYYRKDPLKTMREMGQKYGSVFGFYIGSQYVVVLNDWDSLTDAYSQTSTLDRPHDLFAEVPYHFGFGGRSGPSWLQSRRLSTKVVKDIGLHHTRWEELIKEETSEIIESIIKHGEGPLEVISYLSNFFVNNILTLVLGKRLPAGHTLTRNISESVDAIIENTPILDMVNYSPKLRKLLEILGLEKEHTFLDGLKKYSNVISNIVDEKIRNPEEESKDSFIDRYYSEVENNRDKPNNYVTDEDLKGDVVLFLNAGSETSRTSVIWTLVAMADHPEKQQKVHEELDRIIGRDGSIRWADRMKVPYTYATLLESMRWKTLVPFTTLRMTSTDLKIQGYHIPKGSFMFAHSWMLHNDPKYWDKPEKFLPERFLLEDGKRVNTSPKSYNPFSYGKRNCPGKLIAMMEILVFFCKLMQKFKVVSEDGEKVKYDTRLGITWHPTSIRLRFIPRDKE